MGDAYDSDAVTLPPPSPSKREVMHRGPAIKISSQTFVTLHADKEHHPWKFQILPFAREEKFASGLVYDKLSESIKAGGGVVANRSESEDWRVNGYTIKILDLDYARENIHNIAVQEMLLPYDCFSSNFIWSQIYQRLHESFGNVDLNAFRITPSAYREFDANAVVKGIQPWIGIPSLPPEKLVTPISIKRVALFMFSDLLLERTQTRSKRRIYSRKDSQLLLDKVCELMAHGRVQGCSLYKEIAGDYFTDRSWSSLREHFRKTILPHVLANDGYYTVTFNDFERFRNSLNADEMSRKRDSK
ncbi:hypothetical protein Ocin01_09109 [Orchesella cincta]|uniref:TERF2-interacting telomeric protein 1 Myb domain-containing protein n=1 Tax=Orchesella cincta TaxID=48709 RepID=A0A1D2MXA1_ORCCI|nr:hypothetical protein Ocin01_09109 [Orchesella cincta]